jgi:hypothetical protein
VCVHAAELNLFLVPVVLSIICQQHYPFVPTPMPLFSQTPKQGYHTG